MLQTEIDVFCNEIKQGVYDTEKLRQFIRNNILTNYSGYNHPFLSWAYLEQACNVSPGNINFIIGRCDWCDHFEWKVKLSGPFDNCSTCTIIVCPHCNVTYSQNNGHHCLATVNYENTGSIQPNNINYPPGTHSPDGLINSYHTKITPIIHYSSRDNQKASPTTYGIELEVERKPNFPQSLHADIINLLGKKYVLLKRDGSLSNGGAAGFEIVTAPATFNYILKESAWEQFFEKFADSLKAAPDTTGLHIHVGSKGLTALNVGKFWQFNNNIFNLPFLSWIADRDLSHNEYTILTPHHKITKILGKRHVAGCPVQRDKIKGFTNWHLRDPWRNVIIESLKISNKYKTISICTCEENRYPDVNRHEAINFNTQLPTFETRIFRGKMDANFFFSCIEFTDALIHFCNVVKKSDLHWEKFLAWFNQEMRRVYPHLAKRFKHARLNHTFYDISKEEQKLLVQQPAPENNPFVTHPIYNPDTFVQLPEESDWEPEDIEF